jgi:hypothetical protein
MIVFVHSLGSLWQEKVLPAGGTRIWNTTGIRHGSRLRSCATIFGQIKFSTTARTELHGAPEIVGGTWITGELVDSNGWRKLALLCRASRVAVPDWYLVTVTEGLIGELEMDSWDASLTALISFSKRGSHQEVMLLMRPFAWLRGSAGCAVLTVRNGKCDWKVTRW